MLTPAEQLFLEQLNRARLDPEGEAARFGIGLNDPDPNTGQQLQNTLDTNIRQPLAANANLSEASDLHSEAYLDGKVILDPNDPNRGHHWVDETSEFETPAKRADQFGYGSDFVGENVAFAATTSDDSTAPQADVHGTAGTVNHHQGLFYSISHRPNLLREDYTEAGIGQVFRTEPDPAWRDAPQHDGTEWTASVVTNKFGREDSSDRFLTGVAYEDADGNGFYSLGEGVAGVTITALGQSATTADAGGYGLNLGEQPDPVAIEAEWQGTTLRAEIDMSESNVKLDIVDGTRLMASSDMTLGSGLTEGGLLGAADLTLIGNDLDNLLLIGRGNNTVNGIDGENTVWFTGGFDDYTIDLSGGIITVTDDRDAALNDGVNTLENIQLLRFADGVYTPDGNPTSDAVPTPQITMDEPGFGAYMGRNEQSSQHTLTGTTQDIPNGTEILLELNGQEHSVRTESGQWAVTLSASDLSGLQDNSSYTLTATAQMATEPQASFGFETHFSGPSSVTPANNPFAQTLDADDMTDGVTVQGSSDSNGGTITFTLNGIDHSGDVADDGSWSVDFPASTLATLEDGESYALDLVLEDRAGNGISGSGFLPFTADIDAPAPEPDPEPTLSLDTLAVGDVMNAAEQQEDLEVSGGASDADGAEVAVTLDGQTYTGTVSGGSWTVTIPASALAALQDSQSYEVSATVSTAGGEATAQAAFETDFTPPDLSINQVSDGTLTLDDLDADLDITGSSNAPGQTVTVGFAGESYDAQAGANGDWSITVPQSVLAGLDASLDEIEITAQISDAAGNTADASRVIAADLEPDDDPLPDPDPDDPDTVALMGEVHDQGGESLNGTYIWFTPKGHDEPAGVVQSNNDGGFGFGLPHGAEGHLNAWRPYQTGDPQIDAGDALDVLRLAVGLEPSFGPAAPQHFVAADIDQDGEVTAADALDVLRTAVGLESGNAPYWVFFDDETDWDAQDLHRGDAEMPRDIEIPAMSEDREIALTGILLGNMEAV